MSEPKVVLSADEIAHCAVALAKVQAVLSYLSPIAERSAVLSRTAEHIREASVLLALAVYKRHDAQK